MRFIYVVLAVMISLVVAPVLAQDTTPHVEKADCWMTIPDGLQEGKDLECGYLVVPEDRTSNDGKTIQVAFAVLHPSAAHVKPDPLIYLAGGPGGNAVGEIDGWVGTTYVQDRDLILLDQRGTGYSLPSLNCPEAEQNEDNATQTCHDRLVQEGVNLQAYNSVENAADVADLRVALGYNEWNIDGVSYGTRLALTVMRDHPEGVRSVIIDSVYPPEVSSWEEYGQNTADEFNKFFSVCASNSECSTAYPDLEQTFGGIVEKLNAEPAHYSGSDASGNAVDKDMSGNDFIDRVFQVLYSTESIPYLPKVITEVAAGNYAALDDLESGAMAQQKARQAPAEDLSDSEGMNLSVDCQEEVQFMDVDKAVANVPAEPSWLHDSSVTSVQGAFSECQTWGLHTAAPIETHPVVSDIPTLVVAGELDPITPAKWAEGAASHLKNSFYFLFPGGGHGVIDMNECSTGIMQAFLDDPTQKPDGSCIANIGEPQWVLPS